MVDTLEAASSRAPAGLRKEPHDGEGLLIHALVSQILFDGVEQPLRCECFGVGLDLLVFRHDFPNYYTEMSTGQTVGVDDGEMLPLPTFTTKEWPVQGARESVRVMLVEKDDGAFFTSVQRCLGGDNWEHVEGSAVAHIKKADADDRVEMLLQGGWKLLLAS